MFVLNKLDKYICHHIDKLDVSINRIKVGIESNFDDDILYKYHYTYNIEYGLIDNSTFWVKYKNNHWHCWVNNRAISISYPWSE